MKNCEKKNATPLYSRQKEHKHKIKIPPMGVCFHGNSGVGDHAHPLVETTWSYEGGGMVTTMHA